MNNNTVPEGATSGRSKSTYAAAGARWAAAMLDSLGTLLAAIFLLAMVRLAGWTGGGTSALLGCWLVISIGYHGYMDASSLRGSAGKRMMGLRVTTVTAQRITPQRAFVRSAIAHVSLLALGIPILRAFKNRKGQALHDLMTATVVLRKPGSGLARSNERLFGGGSALGLVGLLAVTLLATGPMALRQAQIDQRAPSARSSNGYGPTIGSSGLPVERQLQLGMDLADPLLQYILETQQRTGQYPAQLPEPLKLHIASEPTVAVKYNPGDGSVHIHVGSVTRRGTMLLTPRSPVQMAESPATARAKLTSAWSCGTYGIQADELPLLCLEARAR